MKKIRIFSGFSGFKDNRVKILMKNLIRSWYLIIMKPAIALDSILQAYEARNLLGGHNFLTYTLSAHCGWDYHLWMEIFDLTKNTTKIETH